MTKSNIRVYSSWRDVLPEYWPWKDFSPQEMACRGTGKLVVDSDAMNKLQKMRELLGKPLIVNSAYRSPEYNKRVGGVPGSQHTKGNAYDLSTANHNPMDMIKAAELAGFTGFGHYPKQSFLHVDTGRARKWNDGSWFKDTVVNHQPTPDFKPEPKPPTPTTILTKPEVLIPVGTAIGSSGLAPVLASQSPVAWAIGAILVMAAVGFIGYQIVRRRQPKETEG